MGLCTAVTGKVRNEQHPSGQTWISLRCLNGSTTLRVNGLVLGPRESSDEAGARKKVSALGCHPCLLRACPCRERNLVSPTKYGSRGWVTNKVRMEQEQAPRMHITFVHAWPKLASNATKNVKRGELRRTGSLMV
jgi:hypothetical protein